MLSRAFGVPGMQKSASLQQLCNLFEWLYQPRQWQYSHWCPPQGYLRQVLSIHAFQHLLSYWILQRKYKNLVFIHIKSKFTYIAERSCTQTCYQSPTYISISSNHKNLIVNQPYIYRHTKTKLCKSYIHYMHTYIHYIRTRVYTYMCIYVCT